MPQRRVLIPFALSNPGGFVLTSNSLVTQAMNAAGGPYSMYCQPFPVPDDMDVTRPADIWGNIQLPVANLADNLNIVMVFRSSKWPRAETRGVFSDRTHIWPVPNPGAALTRYRVHIGTTSNPVFPANTWKHGEIMAFNWERNAAHASDNYPQQSWTFYGLEFEYYLRCQRCCC